MQWTSHSTAERRSSPSFSTRSVARASLAFASSTFSSRVIGDGVEGPCVFHIAQNCGGGCYTAAFTTARAN